MYHKSMQSCLPGDRRAVHPVLRQIHSDGAVLTQIEPLLLEGLEGLVDLGELGERGELGWFGGLRGLGELGQLARA